MQITTMFIIDNFGLNRFDNEYQQALMDFIEDRDTINPTIITSQIPTFDSHDIIGEGTIADLSMLFDYAIFLETPS